MTSKGHYINFAQDEPQKNEIHHSLTFTLCFYIVFVHHLWNFDLNLANKRRRKVVIRHRVNECRSWVYEPRWSKIDSPKEIFVGKSKYIRVHCSLQRHKLTIATSVVPRLLFLNQWFPYSKLKLQVFLCIKKQHQKWLSLKSSYLTKKKFFGMTLLHAHAQYIYIVNAKYQKPSVKALVQVDSLYMHKQNPYLKANRKKMAHFKKLLFCQKTLSGCFSKSCGTSWIPRICTTYATLRITKGNNSNRIGP